MSPIPTADLPRTAELHGVDAADFTARFRAEVLPANRPVILRGLVKHWPVVQAAQVSDQAVCEYLLPFSSGARIPLTLGDPAAGRHLFYREGMAGLTFERRPTALLDGLRLLLAHAADATAPAIYMDSMPLPACLPQLAGALPLPLMNPQVMPRIWIGNAVRVQTHFDLAQNLACVVAGRRRFTLFPPEQLPNLYIGPIDFTPAGPPVSMVDLEAPDYDRYPRFREALAHAQVAELDPGDALYLPYAWWHQVQSLSGFNILINYWWTDAPPPTKPFDALLHAVLAFRHMPPEQQAVWRGLFDYFAFEQHGPALAHLAPEHRGLMGLSSAQQAEAIRGILGEAFKRG
ncbi:cupin-like domain-containing protein [Roseateles sp.]|uniref:cupin-like domain-containing protein n=1 Tax=Roseateles sp. TaxID=1971397 RepID=UPI00394A3731